MNIYKEATRQKLRFNTPIGVIGVEDLWNLSLEQLNDLAKRYRKESTAYQNDDFLNPTPETRTSKTIKLRFNIVLNILKTKQKESAYSPSAEGSTR